MIQLNNKDVMLKQKILLGIGFLGIFFSHQGIGILAIPYYQMTLGVDPFFLALAIKAPVFVASFISPLVGYWSDKLQTPYGRRRPFLFVFPWLSCIVFGFIWMVPIHWAQTYQLYYFSFMALLFYAFNACWTLPMKCLAYEASNNYHERTKVMAFVTYFLKLGGITYHWIFPLAKLSIFGGVVLGMQYVGWGVAIVCLGCFGMLPALFLKERDYKKTEVNKNLPLLSSLNAIIKNKNMKILLILIAVQLTVGSFAASMDYYVLVYYMNDGNILAGATSKGILSSSYAIAGIAAIYVLTSLSTRIGKVNTLKWSYRVTIIGGFAKWFIYQPGNDWWLVLDAILCCSIWASIGVIVSSMIADQIDADEVANKVRREGLFASLQYWIIAIASTIAMIGSGLTLNLIGFDALLGINQSPTSLLLMRVILVSGTIISAVVGYFFISKYSLDEEAFEKIKHQLAEKHSPTP
ncbi:MFS transporter [Pseudoalteromonas sp. SWN166]|uniref:MFS transporter n=1 Tax=Pseudoalteromonas sp. SWN166 TaxID=2792061 RepID=UPI0018CE7D87|nr:MFS transporter [Pseudoalteromonas sp. SWN166]MBH0040459.1 MFS transporter [Pseudoalteromonas sp. SWN166]